MDRNSHISTSLDGVGEMRAVLIIVVGCSLCNLAMQVITPYICAIVDVQRTNEDSEEAWNQVFLDYHETMSSR